MKDRAAWSQSANLANCLGANHARFMDLYQGCNGSLAALEMAALLLGTDSSIKRGLVATADCFPAPLCNKWSMDQMTYYGDGAGVWLLGKERCGMQVLTINSAFNAEFNDFIFDQYGSFLDVQAGLTAKNFSLCRSKELWQQKRSVEEIINAFKSNSQTVIQACLAEASLDRKQIDLVCLPNFSKPLLESMVLDYGFSLEETLFEYGRCCGHMGSSDPMVSLVLANRDKPFKAGQRILVVTHGAGISSMASILEVV